MAACGRTDRLSFPSLILLALLALPQPEDARKQKQPEYHSETKHAYRYDQYRVCRHPGSPPCRLRRCAEAAVPDPHRRGNTPPVRPILRPSGILCSFLSALIILPGIIKMLIKKRPKASRKCKDCILLLPLTHSAGLQSDRAARLCAPGRCRRKGRREWRSRRSPE